MNPKEKKANKTHSASLMLQITLLVLFSVFLARLLYTPIVSFTSDDEPPPVEQITPRKIIQMGGDPDIVNTGLYIRDLPVFDISQDQFTADVTIWFRFDPKRISLEKIGKFKFDRANIVYKSKPLTQKEGNLLFARYYLRIKFTTKLYYRNFPLDDHKISLSLTNYHLSPEDAIFKSYRSDIVMNPEIHTPGWILVDKSVKIGYIEDQLDPYYKKRRIYHPRIIFILDFSRSGIRHIISIIIPLILIFFIALFTLNFNPKTEYSSLIGISVASISAVIAHRFVIEGMSPKPGYLMLSDNIFVVLLIGVSIIFIMNILGKKIPRIYKNIILIALYIYVALSFLYFLYPLL